MLQGWGCVMLADGLIGRLQDFRWNELTLLNGRHGFLTASFVGNHANLIDTWLVRGILDMDWVTIYVDASSLPKASHNSLELRISSCCITCCAYPIISIVCRGSVASASTLRGFASWVSSLLYLEVWIALLECWGRGESQSMMGSNRCLIIWFTNLLLETVLRWELMVSVSWQKPLLIPNASNQHLRTLLGVLLVLRKVSDMLVKIA